MPGNSNKKKSFPLRIDPKLYAIMEKWAQDEFRSVNAHLEFILREAARKAGRLKDAQSILDQGNKETDD